MSQNAKLKSLAKLCFKLGCIAFGGPASHIAMLEDEVVSKRKWMTHEHFLDLMGATNIIPGPNSTEMVLHCGHERAGWKGLVVAGFCFIFPAVFITMGFAWFYQLYGELPEVKPFIYGIQPAVIAIIIMAAFRLGKKALKTMELGVLGLLALTLNLLGLTEIAVLFGCGALGIVLFYLKKRPDKLSSIIPVFLLNTIDPLKISIVKIGLIFLKVGAILYGSGYVLFAFLDSELVARGWLSSQQLIDAVAVGQFTPGPVLSTATFIGWQMHGFSGALAATLGIFLPSFLFVLLLNPWIPKLRSSKAIGAFLDAVNIAAVALILAVCIQMGKASFNDWRSLVILGLSLILVFGAKKFHSAFVVFFGAGLGFLLSLI